VGGSLICNINVENNYDTSALFLMKPIKIFRNQCVFCFTLFIHTAINVFDFLFKINEYVLRCPKQDTYISLRSVK
jgi:hypothetical protein